MYGTRATILTLSIALLRPYTAHALVAPGIWVCSLENSVSDPRYGSRLTKGMALRGRTVLPDK